MEVVQQYLSIADAATFAGLAHVSIRRAIKAGRLKAWNVGGSELRPTYRIAVDDLRDFVQAVPASSVIEPPKKRKARKAEEDWQDYFGSPKNGCLTG